MLKKILIPLDRSSLAEQVLDHLRWLVPAQDATLVLMSVLEPWRYLYNRADNTPPEMVDYLREGARDYLKTQQALLQQQGFEVYWQVCEGDPAETILEVAEAEQVDLIAMSTHGRSGFIRWALGSVAERVIHEARVPIFLVREQTPAVTEHETWILVPLDGSKVAEAALPLAQHVAAAIGANVLLLRALDVLDGEGISVLFDSEVTADEMMAQWQAEAETYLDSVAKQLRADGMVVETRVVLGSPDRMICDVASYEGIDLIVMSTHGRSGISRWVYGSTANKVLRAANCPLMLVRFPTAVGDENSRADHQDLAVPIP